MNIPKAPLERIDFLIRQEKRIMGNVVWHDENRPKETCSFKAPLAFSEEALAPLDGQILLSGRAATEGRENWLSIIITMTDMPVDRLAYLPRRGHMNKNPSWSPAELHRLFFPPLVHRRYSWWDNRNYPHDHKQEMARRIEEKLIDAEDAIRYILRELSIVGKVPPPPFQPTLGL